MNINTFDVIHSLVGGQITGGGEDVSSYVFHDNQTPPTEKQIQTKIAELEAEYDAQEYSRKREAEYPSVQECVHAILDNQLDALQAKRAEIKTKYPKGG
jgi:hypothetical protein